MKNTYSVAFVYVVASAIHQHALSRSQKPAVLGGFHNKLLAMLSVSHCSTTVVKR